MKKPRPHFIEPDATLGVMGGGQLGRMFVHAAQSMGYRTAVLDETADSPAGSISHHHIRTAYTDPAGLQQLAKICAAVTTEFENVPAQALETLSQHISVAPGAQAVAICQNRATEKAYFRKSGVLCAPHAIINKAEDLADIDNRLFPGILKTTTQGYDGKGQAVVENAAELATAWQQMNQISCVLEKKMPLAYEISVMVARGHDGQCIHFPVQRNLHRQGILAVTEVSWDQNWLPLSLQKEAFDAAKKLAQTMEFVGVLCVEFFVLENNVLVANEMAPRPHNSGHWTIDGCYCSQFEAQVRTLAGLPLVEPKQHSSAVMLNLLGDLWLTKKGEQRCPAWDRILTIPGAHLHLYGKAEARPGRKMGHLTITATRLNAAQEAALEAARILGIEPW